MQKHTKTAFESKGVRTFEGSARLVGRHAQIRHARALIVSGRQQQVGVRVVQLQRLHLVRMRGGQRRHALLRAEVPQLDGRVRRARGEACAAQESKWVTDMLGFQTNEDMNCGSKV